jgi:hypothetical protein
MDRGCSRRWAKSNAHRVLLGKPEGRRPLRRTGLRWEYNIKMDPREIAWDGIDWVDLVQETEQWRDLVNTVMNFWVR